jgi:hypothetical protein
MFCHNRYYSPGLRRFVSPDPLRYGGGDMNYYSYAYDSTVEFNDLTGLSGGGFSGKGSGDVEFPVPSFGGYLPSGGLFRVPQV